MRDILLDTDGDLKLDGYGSVIMGVSDNQHQNLLLLTTKSAWKENISAGVGLFNFLESEDKAGLFLEINAQFSADGMKVKSLGIVNNKIEIDAPYS